MRHEPMLPRDDKPFDLSSFARGVVLSGIEAVADDPGEMKHRIMLARQCGFLSDAETADWIRKNGLEGA
jgi:hypothetical protein